MVVDDWENDEIIDAWEDSVRWTSRGAVGDGWFINSNQSSLQNIGR